MDELGTLTFLGRDFPAHTARMVATESDDGPPRTGYYFLIAACRESVEGDYDENCPFDGAALFADDEPIPLPIDADLSGREFYLPAAWNDETGGCYFMFDPGEACHVTDARLQFFERGGDRYRVKFTVVVPSLSEKPVEVRYAGWVEVSLGPLWAG